MNEAREKLRTAVIGVGHLGQIHARIYRELDHARLVGVVDADQDRARAVAAEYSTDEEPVRVIEDPRDLVDAIDAVSIVVPTPAHLEAARPFLEAGRAVLVEKPLASTLEQADTLIELADTHGAVLQVGHIERFNPVLTAALPHIANPLFIECDRIHPFNLRSTDVSVVLDLMIHDIDLILHVIEGEVESVDALGAKVLSSTEDLATARLVFESGCVAMVKTSRVAMNRARKIRIFCERSYFSLDLVARSGFATFLDPSYDPEKFTDASGRIVAPEGEMAFLAKHLEMRPLVIEAHEPLKVEIESFLDAVRTGEEPKVTGLQGRRAMKVADEIHASIRYHKDRVQGRLAGPRDVLDKSNPHP